MIELAPRKSWQCLVEGGFLSKILVVASQKGGVGKTTLSLNLAYSLAKRSWRTLLIDADAQGSIGYSIQGDLHRQVGLSDVLGGQASLSDAIVGSRLPEFKILPVGVIPPSQGFQWSVALESGTSLQRLFSGLRDDYDVVVVDTPPTLGGVTLGALRYADYVLMPIQAEPLAARSVRHLLEVVGELRDQGAPLQIAGLVLSMLQSRHEASLAVAQETWRLFPQELLFEASIPRDNAFLEASAVGTPLALLHRRPPAVSMVFDQIAAELEGKMGLEIHDHQAIPLLG